MRAPGLRNFCRCLAPCLALPLVLAAPSYANQTPMTTGDDGQMLIGYLGQRNGVGVVEQTDGWLQISYSS